MFKLDNIDLSFDEEALEFIVDKALEFKLGARGLRAIMEETLLAVMYEVPSRKDVERVVVTPESVAKEAAPTYILRGTGPKRSKAEKAADKSSEEKSA